METSGIVCGKVFFLSDFAVTSGNSHLSFLPVVSESADITPSAPAARLFTLFLILNLTDVSLSHQLAAIPENLLCSSTFIPFLPSFYPPSSLFNLSPASLSPSLAVLSQPVLSQTSSPASIQIRFLTRSCSSCCQSIDTGQTRVLELPRAENVPPGSQNRQQFVSTWLDLCASVSGFKINLAI